MPIDNERIEEIKKRRFWLFKSDQHYFETIACKNDQVRQCIFLIKKKAPIERKKKLQKIQLTTKDIKCNSILTKSYKKGDFVIVWYNYKKHFAAFYEIDCIDEVAEEWYCHSSLFLLFLLLQLCGLFSRTGRLLYVSLKGGNISSY